MIANLDDKFEERLYAKQEIPVEVIVFTHEGQISLSERKKKMRKMKIIVWILSIALMLVAMPSCSKGDGKESQSSDAPSSTKTKAGTEETHGGIPLEEIKIGALLNGNREDGSWSQSKYEALINVLEALDMREEQLIVMDEVSDYGTTIEANIEMLIDAGCNLIIGTSSGYSSPISHEAALHPEILFHQFEGIVSDNCASYTVRDYEAIFMCGYVAAKMSDVDELGFVAAQPQASVVRAINAWATGAKYANPNATVKVVWTNSWFDPQVEKENANSLFDSGIKCIGYHGATGVPMQAAREKGGFATGFHRDMNHYAPEAVLTSFVWNWTPVFIDFVKDAVSGTWNSDLKFKGLDSGAASIAPYNASIIPEEVIEECKRVEDKVKAGEIQVFYGPVYDNKGNLVLAEGQEFTDEEWIGMMYLAENVVGDLP